MQSVTISVHPLSARVLAAQYGGPVIGPFGKQDCVFDLLASDTRASVGSRREYTAQVTFIVNARYATYIRDNARVAAMRLFRYHKNLMCWYVKACQSCRVPVKTAIRQWMEINGVSEDDFSSETAYKTVQRFFWKKAPKNALKVSGVNNKTAVASAKKIADGEQVNLAVATFLEKYRMVYRRVPEKLPKQARLYFYILLSDASNTCIAKVVKVPRATVDYTLRIMRRKCARNPLYSSLFEEIAAAVAN